VPIGPVRPGKKRQKCRGLWEGLLLFSHGARLSRGLILHEIELLQQLEIIKLLVELARVYGHDGLPNMSGRLRLKTVVIDEKPG